MSFFKVCVTCKHTFFSEEEYNKHRAEHSNEANARRKTTAEEIANRFKAETAVFTGAISDEEAEAKLKATRATLAKRKKLIAAGIEAATMTTKQVEERYDEEKKSGRVK